MTDKLETNKSETNFEQSQFHRSDFLLFLCIRACSVFATSILSVAVGWHIYKLTGSVLNLGLVGLAQFLPVLLLFLVAGFVADRIDRRYIITVCYLVNAAVSIGIGLFLLTGRTEILPLYVLLAVHGSSRAFSHPATQAMLPNIVPRTELPKAIATSASISKLSQLGGPAFGGLMIALIDEASYFVISGLFIAVAIASYLIRINLRVSGKEPFSLDTILGGFRHIRSEKIVLAAISIDLVAVLFGGIMGLLPVFAIDILQVGPEYLGLMRACPGIGALLIALMLARYQLPWPVGSAFFVSLIVFGLSILLFSFSKTLWLSLVALTIYGGADMISVYVRQTLVQLRTPDELRGRVSAVNSVSINASNELGDFRSGVMAAIIGTVPAVAFGAVITLLATAVWWRWFPELRDLEEMQ